MIEICFKRYRFPPEIIRHAVWLYARFTLSFRDVEDLLAERGIDVSNETVRRWFLKFGRLAAEQFAKQPRTIEFLLASRRDGDYHPRTEILAMARC